MRERLRHGLAAALLVGALASSAVALGAGAASAGGEATEPPEPTTTVTMSADPTGSATPSDESTPTPTPAPTAAPTDSATVVSNAQLRWGMSNESNNRAYAPDTFNSFSAGVHPDPGRGGVAMTEGQWQQRAGQVAVEKWDGTTWRPATWAGLGTDSAGAPLGAPTAGTFSNHSFVFGAGAGTVDPAADAAHITWDGDVSVLYYSGMSYFVVSDPVLDLTGGSGAVTATLSGFASSQSDPDVWEPVAPAQVTVATLSGVDVTAGGGFQATPAYAAVSVTGVPQVRTGAGWGSFPQSYVDYLARLGSAAFWYSSGGSADPFKVALPLSVSLDGSAPLRPSVATPQPTRTPEVTNAAEPAPARTPSPTPPAAPSAQPPVAQPVAAAPPPAAPVAEAPDTAALLNRPETRLRLTAASTAPAAARTTWPWWGGGACLLLAALSLLLPTGRSDARTAPPA